MVGAAGQYIARQSERCSLACGSAEAAADAADGSSSVAAAPGCATRVSREQLVRSARAAGQAADQIAAADPRARRGPCVDGNVPRS